MVSEAFPKSEKILKRKDYLSIQQCGLREYTKNFVIIKKRTETGVNRLGISVSKKTGGAVQRNRIKRLVREFFRLHKSRINDSQDMIIVAKKGIPHNLTYGDVCRELEGHFITKTDD
ncbi:MAG: ribonuclease P protein component [Syntrophales bacterium]|jgi:ribonuclease P protein component|nr:ribonuclease P protein component [Syntrophales bacterium]NLN60331.1 ribonuclease P protein component [Deltaproteobacteria bacterium]